MVLLKHKKAKIQMSQIFILGQVTTVSIIG